jgi:signal transduction histidine kinase
LVMLARDNQQTLVPVSMNELHLAATPLSFEVARDAALAQCVTQRKVVFSRRKGLSPSVLLEVMDCNEVVVVPLLTAQHCLGVLAANVPAELSQHLKTQLPTLQAFGVYAGLALSRRRQGDKNRAGQTMTAKQAQELELKRVVQAVNLLVQTLAHADQGTSTTVVDLTLAVRDTVQLLQHRQLIPGNIDISSELPNRAAWVQGSLGKIKQILLILIKNACESMPDGGQIVINGGALMQRDGGVYTLLTVADSGASVKEVIQARLYEQQPAALGAENFDLATVNQLVERMAGHIKFSASPSGTRFDVFLPCPRHPTV